MTDEPKIDRLLELVKGMESDARRAVDDVGWACVLGWDAPARPRPVAGTALPPRPPRDPAEDEEDEDPDRVPGPKWDPGVGDYAARRAAVTSAPKLASASRHLAAALDLMEPGERVVATVTGLPSRRALQALAGLVLFRATSLRQLIEAIDESRRPRKLERSVLAAHSDIRSALGCLGRALNRGPVLIAEPEDVCRVCEARPRHPKKGGRCNVCDRWFWAHGRRERPRSLDRRAVEEAEEARDRRRARSEGWGAA